MDGFCCLLVPHRVILNDEKSLVLGIYNRKNINWKLLPCLPVGSIYTDIIDHLAALEK